MSIIINGGGIVGVLLALILSRLSNGELKISLISSYAFEDRKNPSFDSRSIALTWGTYDALLSMGIWSFLSSYATVIKRIEISNYLNLGEIIISASDYKLLILGYVIELHNVGVSLLNLLKHSLNISLYCPAILKEIERRNSITKVILDDGSEIYAKLLIAADGSCSPLAFRCGIRWNKYDYKQIAVTSNIITMLSHNYSAFEKFTEHSSVALLPISNDHSALIWCCPSEWRSEIFTWSTQEFCKTLQGVLGWRLGRILDASQRNCYFLNSYIAERLITHRLVLVGNAAQTLHPFAGQSLNLGLRDIMTLAKILVAANARGEDIGNYSILYKYYQSRQLDRTTTINYVDGIVRLFSDDRFLLTLCRNVGFFVMSHSSFLQNFFIKSLFSWIVR